MKQRRLSPYIFLSFLIHAGILIGLYRFQFLPPEVEPAELIPVEVIVYRETPIFSQPRLMTQDLVSRSKSLEINNGIATHPDVDELDGMVPKPIVDEIQVDPTLPVMSIELTSHIVQVNQVTEEPAGTTIASITRTPNLEHLAVNALPPGEPPSLAIETPAFMVEAKPVETLDIRMMPHRIVGVPKKSRGVSQYIFEPRIAAPVEEPHLVEKGDMMLAEISDHSFKFGSQSEVLRKSQLVFPPYIRSTTPYGPTISPEVMIPGSEPAALNLDDHPSFPFPGSAKSAAFLLVVDTSGSVKGSPLKGIRRAARDFVSLMGPNDLAGIITFDDTAKLVMSFTAEKETVQKKINKLHTTGTQTVLYDALTVANEVINKEHSENRFIVLFSDGKDEGSHAKLEKVIQSLRRSSISILAVGYSRVEIKYLKILRRIAGETNGIFVYTPQLHDIIDLYRVSRNTTIEAPRVESVKQAFLDLNSQPEGAQVFVNGKLKGKTPILLELPFGKYEVLLSMPAHYDWRAQIRLNKTGQKPVHIRLLPVEERK